MLSRNRVAAAVVCIAIVVACGIVVGRWHLARQSLARAESERTEPEAIERLGPLKSGAAQSSGPVQVVEERPPITEFELVKADEADKWVHPEELVIGVVLKDQARAYVINTLTGPAREIFNDTLAGRPIAATW